MLYSYNNQYPKPVPFRIRLPDGRTRTDPNTFTAEELLNSGYIQVPEPPDINANQALSWDHVSLSWIVRDKNAEELEQEFIAQVPSTVSMRQARLALLEAGLLDTVDQTIQSLVTETVEDPTLGTVIVLDANVARIEWNYSQTVTLHSPIIHAVSQKLNLTKDQVYQLFIRANQL